MIERFLPDLTTLLMVTPLALLVTLATAWFVGWLRIQHNLHAPYTRKLFHFLIITSAVFVQLRAGLPGTVVYAAVVALAVLFAVARGPGFAFYEALARPSDAPHARLFILVPLLTTALGGLLANILFPAWAHVGYFVVAWGDAVGEPIGTRWGKHRYRVPSLARVPVTRSLEGSAAVLLVSTAAACAALALVAVPLGQALTTALVVGAACTLVEAVSNHGIDNLTVQITAAGLTALLS